MNWHFERLLATAADDGAFTLVRTRLPRTEPETDDPTEQAVWEEAWRIECQGRIESELILEQVRRLLGRVSSDARETLSRRREAHRLIGVIDSALGARRDDR